MSAGSNSAGLRPGLQPSVGSRAARRRQLDEELLPDTLTLAAAAALVGVDRRVIRRHLEDGRFPGAVRAGGGAGAARGPWRIPLRDLRSAGLLPWDRVGPSEADGPVLVPVDGRAAVTDAHALTQPGAVPDPGPEVVRLRAELHAARRRAEAAEAALRRSQRIVEAQRRVLAEREARGTDESAARHRATGSSPTLPAGSVTEPPPDADASGLTDRPAGQPEAPVTVAPRFAATWASVPPWEHAPADVPDPPRRWWRRAR